MLERLAERSDDAVPVKSTTLRLANALLMNDIRRFACSGPHLHTGTTDSTHRLRVDAEKF